MSLAQMDTAPPREQASTQKREQFVIKGGRGCASATVRRCATLCRVRCCQSNGSGGPPRLGVGIVQRNARVCRVIQELPRPGRRFAQRVHYTYMTQSRPHLLLRRVLVCRNSITAVRRTLFELTRDRREAINGRLPCAVRLCVTQRVSVLRDDVARPLVCVSTEDARDSRSTPAVVVHLKASETVRRGVATDVANDTAQSGPRGRLVALFENVREFAEMAKRAPIVTRGCRGEHATCTQCYPASSQCMEWIAHDPTTRPMFDRRFSNSSMAVAKRRVSGLHELCDCTSQTGVAGAKRHRATARTNEHEKCKRFAVSAGHGFASAGVRTRSTWCHVRCCQLFCSVWPARPTRRVIRKSARVSRFSRELPRPGQRLAWSARCIHVTRSRI
jgi:hypothetical protein